ncbi:Tyrosine-protein kinase, partial [Fasciola gigantica]
WCLFSPSNLFRVRFRREDATFVLSLCCQSAPKHYKIEERLGRWSIEGGQYFETLIEMIDHYHHRQDGLLCKLRRPVVAPSFTRSRSGSSTGTQFMDGHIPRHKEDSAVQTSFISTGDVTTWNGSHSLPSLSHSPPITTTTSVSSQSTNVPHPVKGDVTQPKQDLISFADWPNVNRLLAEQAAAASNSRFITPNSTDQQPVVPITPETPVPNPAIQMIPTPTNTFLFPNESSLFLLHTGSGSATLGKPKPENNFEHAWSPGEKRLR